MAHFVNVLSFDMTITSLMSTVKS